MLNPDLYYMNSYNPFCEILLSLFMLKIRLANNKLNRETPLVFDPAKKYRNSRAEILKGVVFVVETGIVYRV